MYEPDVQNERDKVQVVVNLDQIGKSIPNYAPDLEVQEVAHQDDGKHAENEFVSEPKVIWHLIAVHCEVRNVQ